MHLFWTNIYFFGNDIGNNFRKINSDFGYESKERAQVINIYIFIREKYVVQSGVVSLGYLEELTVREILEKVSDILFSKWSVIILDNNQAN